MSDAWDLSSLTLEDLLALRVRLDRAITAALRRTASEPQAVARAALLASFGLTPEDVSKRQASALAGAKLPPKYRDPANAANTWSGRGRAPRWFKDAIASGRRAEDMEIATT